MGAVPALAVFTLALAVAAPLFCASSAAPAPAQSASASSPATGVHVLQAVLGPSPAAPAPLIDPGMHAFFTDYLVSRWKLRISDAQDLAAWVLRYSEIYDVDAMVQLARILKESRGRHYRLPSRGAAGGVVRGSANEIGYSQIMPFWAGKQVEDLRITRQMLFDPEGNVRAGIALYRRYRDDAPDYLMALSRYNHPGASRPNSYALAVERIVAEIQRCHVEFLVRQPSFYCWPLGASDWPGCADDTAFDWTEAFTLNLTDYPCW